jgi:hypothetical protein
MSQDSTKSASAIARRMVVTYHSTPMRVVWSKMELIGRITTSRALGVRALFIDRSSAVGLPDVCVTLAHSGG